MTVTQVYVVGDVGIEEELDLIGVPHFGGPKVFMLRCPCQRWLALSLLLSQTE